MRRIALASAVLATVVALVACSDSKPPSGASGSVFDPFATGSASASGALQPGTSPSVLAVGDCFNTDVFAPGRSIDPHGVHLVVCSDPHQHQVYAVERNSDPADTPFPGDDALTAYADDICLSDFEATLGDYRQSALDFATIKPDAASWNAGDRSVICAADDVDFDELVGSRLTSTSTSTTSTSLAPESG